MKVVSLTWQIVPVSNLPSCIAGYSDEELWWSRASDGTCAKIAGGYSTPPASLDCSLLPNGALVLWWMDTQSLSSTVGRSNSVSIPGDCVPLP